VIKQIEPWIDNEELLLLTEVISSTQLTEGPMTKRFEMLTKQLTGSDYVVSYANGSTALFAILKTLGIGYGDEVIIPNLTFIATATAVMLTGATPVLCDIEEETLGLDPIKVVDFINAKTRAIIPVHLYGNSADLDPLLEICQSRGLFLIEDAAQGVGVSYKGRHVGTFGDAGVLSYYGNKTITCGEGGAILTNSSELKSRVYAFKNHGRQTKGIFEHEEIGFNFSFTELQAAVGVAQMGKLNRILDAKNSIYSLYKKLLPEEIFFEQSRNTSNYVPWFTSIKTKDPANLQTYLIGMGIESRRFFPPLSKQPCLKDLPTASEKFPISDKIYASGLSLPSSALLKEKEVFSVAEAIKGYREENRH